MLLILQTTRQKHIVNAIGNTLNGGVGKYQFFVDEGFQQPLRDGGDKMGLVSEEKAEEMEEENYLSKITAPACVGWS